MWEVQAKKLPNYVKDMKNNILANRGRASLTMSTEPKIPKTPIRMRRYVGNAIVSDARKQIELFGGKDDSDVNHVTERFRGAVYSSIDRKMVPADAFDVDVRLN